MGRTLTTAHATAIAAPIVSPLWFVQIAFSTVLRLTSGITQTWNGQTWNEAKMVVSGIQFDGSIAQNVTIQLADPSNAYAALCVSQKLTQRPISIWLADANAVATGDPLGMPPLIGDNFSGNDYSVQISAVLAANRELPSGLWNTLLPPQLVITQLTDLAWGGGTLHLSNRPAKK